MVRRRRVTDSSNQPSAEVAGIRELFASKAAKKPLKGGKLPKDNFDKFTDSIDATIADMQRFKETGIVGSPKGWYKVSIDGTVVFKVGRMGLNIAGSTSFEASNIEDAIDLLERAKLLVLHDEEVRSQITEYYSKFTGRRKK